MRGIFWKRRAGLALSLFLGLLLVSPSGCGAGSAGSEGAQCAGGECPRGLSLCGVQCVEIQNNPKHCGECNHACSFPNAHGACARGQCVFGTCREGFADCNHQGEEDGCETDVRADQSNCGACGAHCAFAEACVQGQCVPSDTPPSTLRILSIDLDQCIATDHDSISGDDRGGIAAGRGTFYYMGDSSGVAMETTNPQQQRPVARRDGIFSALGTGELYTLATGNQPFDRACAQGQYTIDAILRLDPLTLNPTGTPIQLTRPIVFPCQGRSNQRMILSGLDFMVFYADDKAYEIALPSGQVSPLGSFNLQPSPQYCENWAVWGVAERFGGETYLTYRSGNSLTRLATSTGASSPVVDLASHNVSDLCSFSIDLSANRWVWHYEGTGGLGGGSESGGSCPIQIDSPE